MSETSGICKGMVSTYRYASGKLSSDYATPDKKAPVISGFVGKNSYNGNIPYQTVYSDQEKTYDYFKYVGVKDNRDAKVTLKVDTSKVNFKKRVPIRLPIWQRIKLEMSAKNCKNCGTCERFS